MQQLSTEVLFKQLQAPQFGRRSIEDIFRNYYIDMRIIYTWFCRFDLIMNLAIILLSIRNYINRCAMIRTHREIKKYNFVSIACALTFYFRPPVFQHGAPLVHINIEWMWVTINNTSGLVAQANHVLNLHCSSSHFKWCASHDVNDMSYCFDWKVTIWNYSSKHGGIAGPNR